MNKQCTGCVVSAGTHKPAEALHQIADHSDGWIQDGPLLYRLTEGKKPQNRDEINVTMADGSRTAEARTRRAGELLDAIRAAAHPAVQDTTQPAEHGLDIVQAAKALCKHAAKVQNINFDDYWLIHAEEFKEEAQIVLDAAQANHGEQQCTSARES